MDLVRSCPCCAREATDGWPALVAPFIAEFVLKTPVEPCKLLECPGCGFRFFDRRFTDAEAQQLYGRYRGAEYFETRHRHEPWYTARFNEALGDQSEVLVRRRERMQRFLEKYLDRARVGSVLDYGGDSGQAIPDGWGRERVVYDLSDAPPMASVRKVSSEAELVPASFDLIMVLHVLEHVAEPVDILRRVRPLLREGGKVFVEVPYERFSVRALGRGPGTERYLAWLAQHPLAFRAVDFVSTAMRVKLGVFPPFAAPKLHEHINFFDERSLAALAERSGFTVRGIERPAFAPPLEATPVVVALLEAREARS